MNLFKQIFSLFTPSQKKVPMSETGVINTQTAQAAVNQASEMIQAVGALASAIPGGAPVVAAAQTAATVVTAVEAAVPAVESVLSALLPLLHAAGHEIGDEWESLVAAAKTLAK